LIEPIDKFKAALARAALLLVYGFLIIPLSLVVRRRLAAVRAKAPSATTNWVEYAAVDPIQAEDEFAGLHQAWRRKQLPELRLLVLALRLVRPLAGKKADAKIRADIYAMS